jgi:hypothetical protein
MRGQILAQADEINRIHRRHEKEFGEEFDSPAFHEWVNGEVEKGERFKSITSAYETYTGAKREDARVEGKVRDELKKRANDNSGQHVPGFTPPSSQSPLAKIMNRGKATDGEGSTNGRQGGCGFAAQDVGAREPGVKVSGQ